jgi:EAL domain-containing protein (putative c-di-GMP-specific phosphodiesterase class I)
VRHHAEFVENDEILRLLRDIGVDFAQGYGVAKPQPMENLFSGINREISRKSAEG